LVLNERSPVGEENANIYGTTSTHFLSDWTPG
jgi:hypothetical protein